MSQDDRKDDAESSDENEVAIALVAECQVGDKRYSAGETWTDEQDECRMSICNPGGVVSYLECPRFDAKEDDPTCVRIPGDNKYAYPHCCDYVFLTKGKKNAGNKEGDTKERLEHANGGSGENNVEGITDKPGLTIDEDKQNDDKEIKAKDDKNNETGDKEKCKEDVNDDKSEEEENMKSEGELEE